ncbi:unnamed protein product, partial [Mesorhabditis spiculigera]
MHRLGIIIPRRGAATASATKKIVIQPKIKRGPTELLEALAATVGPDPTAPHFAFIDDPATIPSQAATKRNYLLAKELGRRAARGLAEEWPTLFAFDREVPRLDVFRPQKTLDPALMEPTESKLDELIEARRVEDAAMLFEKMRGDNVEVSAKAQRKLFLLLTYYGGKNPPTFENIEWHALRVFGVDQPEWKADLIELLYETLEKDAEIKSAMICGFSKYKAGDAKALSIFKEMQAAKEVPHIEAYNSLIASLKPNQSGELLKSMADNKLQPNVDTFNSLLVALKKSFHAEAGPIKKIKEFSRVLGEMKQLKIQPTLHTYAIILSAFYSPPPMERDTKTPDTGKSADKAAGITALAEFLQVLEKAAKVELHGIHDHTFFTIAMKICQDCGNVDMANRVLSLYTDARNEVKMPAFTYENSFYESYLLLNIETAVSLDELEKVYKKFVPNYVGISRWLVYRMLNKLRDQDHWNLSRRLIEDSINAQHLEVASIAGRLRGLLIGLDFTALSPFQREEFTMLVRKMVDVWIEYSRFKDERKKRKLTFSTVIESALLLTRIGDDAKALDLLQLLFDESATTGEEASVDTAGFVHDRRLVELFDHALRQKNVEMATVVLELMSRFFSKAQLQYQASRLSERCGLNKDQTRIIEGFIRLRPQ